MAAEKLIVTAAAPQVIQAALAEERVTTISTCNEVIAMKTVQGVRVRVSNDNVVVGTAFHIFHIAESVSVRIAP
jgi:hypothetical protein